MFTLNVREFVDGTEFQGIITSHRFEIPEEGETYSFDDADGVPQTRPKEPQLKIEIERTDGRESRFLFLPISKSKNSKLGIYLESLSKLGIYLDDDPTVIEGQEFKFLEKNVKRGKAEWRQLYVKEIIKEGAEANIPADPFEGVDVPTLIAAIEGKNTSSLLTAVAKANAGEGGTTTPGHLTAIVSNGKLVSELERLGHIKVEEGIVHATTAA